MITGDRVKITKLYSSNSKEGGGANFELIHQLDMAIFLFGNIKQFSSMQGKVSNFKIAGDDITQILVNTIVELLGQYKLIWLVQFIDVRQKL